MKGKMSLEKVGRRSEEEKRGWKKRKYGSSEQSRVNEEKEENMERKSKSGGENV